MASGPCAKAQGRTGGRPSVVDEDVLTVARARKAKGESVSAIAKALGISRATLYRHLGEGPPETGVHGCVPNQERRPRSAASVRLDFLGGFRDRSSALECGGREPCQTCVQHCGPCLSLISLSTSGDPSNCLPHAASPRRPLGWLTVG
ncbi:helix-turn-helix domain-containing protein [Streptomyces sviceus]|uniref:helix-turn-helix domain-containing protein n=1 Tax=Streptomyces sviceus TaxID=285530 RepID=UPI00367C657C